MAANDVFEARLNFTLYNQKCVNVFHFRQEDADGSGSARAALAALIGVNWVAKYVLAQTDDTTFDSIGVRRVFPTPLQEIVDSVALDGTFSGEAYPPNVTVCMTLYAADGGRRGIGRTYLVGVPEGAANFGAIQDA